MAMKVTYENEFSSLQSWTNNVNDGLASGIQVMDYETKKFLLGGKDSK